MTAPEFPTDRGYPEASQATTALILGIVGLAFTILAPFVWGMAQREIRAIESGRRDPEGLPNARVARVLGIIGSVEIVIGLLLVVLLLTARAPFRPFG